MVGVLLEGESQMDGETCECALFCTEEKPDSLWTDLHIFW